MVTYIDESHPELTDDELTDLLATTSIPKTTDIQLTNLQGLFVAPEEKQNIYNKFTEAFERYRVRVDLFKWLIGTVGLTLITFIINWGFRDREQGLVELQMYDRYATTNVVFAENPKNRLLLSQFYANVTPSKKLREGWQTYLVMVENEVRLFEMQRKAIKDSAAKLEVMLATDSASPTIKLQYIETKEKAQELERINSLQLINENIPLTVEQSTPISNNKLELAKFNERQGFEQLLAKDVVKSIAYFKQSDNAFPGYHNVYDIARYLEGDINLLSTPDSKNWQEAFKQIQTKYGWHMPQDIKMKLIRSK